MRSRKAYTLVELLIAIAMVATLTAIAVPAYQDYIYKAQVTKAVAEIYTMQKEIAIFEVENDRLPSTLAEINRDAYPDPWENPYQYLNFATAGKDKKSGHPKGSRLDRHKNPLNSDYDLYSKGRDGRTALPLQNKWSHDDVVRANDGGFIGLAYKY